MFELIKSIFANLLFYTLHIKGAGSFPKPLSAAEERELLLRMKKNSDNEARSKLIEHNLRLVAHIIKKYYSAYGEQEDLISIGTIGLIKAIDSFDAEKGTRLATYAARCIENEILMHFRAIKKNAGIMSLSEPIDSDSEGNPLTLIDLIFVDDTVAEEIDKIKKSKQLYEYLELFDDEREKEILIMRYGLYDTKEMTQREIAKKLGISRSYVSRIEKRGIEKLRYYFNA